MGLQDDLDYQQARPNVFQRAVARLASTRAGGWLGYHSVPSADRLVARLTRGRGTATEWLAGVPPVWVTTVGARTGQPRRTPLFAIPVGEDLALVATGFGQPPTPAWAHNLVANPSAVVESGGRSLEVVARAATPPEVDEIWTRGATIYPGFFEYRKRLRRAVPMFVLEPR